MWLKKKKIDRYNKWEYSYKYTVIDSDNKIDSVILFIVTVYIHICIVIFYKFIYINLMFPFIANLNWYFYYGVLCKPKWKITSLYYPG